MSLHIFGVHLYLSTKRLKRRSDRDNTYRNNRRKLLRAKHVLYVESGGRCSVCGKQMSEKELEIHHVKPWSDRPDLLTKRSNLRLLCHECHLSEHGKK